MNAVWNTFIDGIQGKHTRPIDIALPTQKYDMGKAVGKKKTAAVRAAVATVKQAKPQTDRPAKRVSMADQVREQIRIAKQTGVDVERVVDWAMGTLGMGRGQANNYVKGNWPKVIA